MNQVGQQDGSIKQVFEDSESGWCAKGRVCVHQERQFPFARARMRKV